MKKKFAIATARSNIAFSKYWGKADVKLNIPAVPSISLSLDGFETTTRVTFDPKLKKDWVFIDNKPANVAEKKRVIQMLDQVRQRAKTKLNARVESRSNFPASSGLASSASGFAALAAASSRAAGLRLTDNELSALARQASASAARSIYGGFVELPAGAQGQSRLSARPLAAPKYWDVRMVVAVVTAKKKKIGSTAAMECARKTSPLYEAWLRHAPTWNRQIRTAIKKRDLEALGPAMEASTFAFHATCFTSSPSIVYWSSTTLDLIRCVRALRDRGVSAWTTMDAGPHVKVLCLAKDATRVRRALASVRGVKEVRIAKPGAGVLLCASSER